MPSKKIYTNTLAQIAGKIMTALISIAMIKILTNYLDIAGYGLYSKIYNFLSIFSVIADLGLYTITVRELSKHDGNKEEQEKISANVFTLRAISGLFIIILSYLIAPLLAGYDSDMAKIGILIAGFFTLLGLMNSSLMSYLQATLKAEYSFITNTLGKLVTFVSIVFSAYFLFTIESGASSILRYSAVMFAGLLGNLVMFIMTYFYTKKQIRIYFAWDKEYIISILKQSLPYGVALFLGAIFFKVDTILLSVLESREMADTAVALYALPMKIVEVGMMYGTIFLTSVLPVLTKQISEGESQKIKHTILQAFEVLFACGLGLSVFLALFSEKILLLLSGQKFIETVVMGYTSVDAFRIVAWIFLFYFLSSLLSFVLIARGEQRKIITINLVVAVVNLVGNYLIIPHSSFVGASYVSLFSQILLIILTFFSLRHTLSPQIFISRIGLFGILGVTSAIITFFVGGLIGNSLGNLLFLTIVGIAFGGIYLPGWWYLRKMLAKSQSSL